MATYNAARKRVYGATPAEVQARLVVVDFCGYKVKVNKAVAQSLKNVTVRVRVHEKKYGSPKWVPTDVQCYCWRRIRGSVFLSMHSGAIALDIMPPRNPQTWSPSVKRAWAAKPGIPGYVVGIMEAEGWTWGGKWSNPTPYAGGYKPWGMTDFMHFEYQAV